MRHMLDARHYISDETLTLENEKIFSKLWIFAGFTSQVRTKHQFFTRRIAGVPVVVQCTEKGIRAFVNECPHRLARIQVDESGKRPLVCPYHAWSFGAEGELRNIPNEGIYGFSPDERERLCLRKVSLRQIGKLIFVNLSSDPLPLEEQFDARYIQRLEVVSNHFDDQIIYSRFRVKYNWKLNIENVKDHNHIAFIHPKSFQPIMAVEKSKSSVEFRAPSAPSAITRLQQRKSPPALSALSYPVKGPIKSSKNKFASLCEPYGDESVYYNWYIYPNVNLGSAWGECFHLQQYEPISPGETDYHLWVMAARRKDERTDFTALLRELIRVERSVVAEDTLVLEGLQSGLGNHSREFAHGDYEMRLVQQHLWYRANVLGEGK